MKLKFKLPKTEKPKLSKSNAYYNYTGHDDELYWALLNTVDTYMRWKGIIKDRHVDSIPSMSMTDRKVNIEFESY